MLAVRWYLRFGLSYRDLEELLAERGIEVDHVTLYESIETACGHGPLHATSKPTTPLAYWRSPSPHAGR